MRKESANFAAMFLPTRLFFQIATCSASYNRVTDHTEHVIAQKKVQIATRQRQNSYKSSLLDLMKNASSNLSFCTEIKIVKPSSVTKIKQMITKKRYFKNDIKTNKQILHIKKHQ